jgi:hypothetical protein
LIHYRAELNEMTTPSPLAKVAADRRSYDRQTSDQPVTLNKRLIASSSRLPTSSSARAPRNREISE